MRHLITFFASLSFLSCINKPPSYSGRWYVGDSDRGGIVYSYNNQKDFISANDELFDDYICLSTSDLELFYKTFVQGCEVWKKDAGTYIKKLERCSRYNKIKNDVNYCLR